MRFYTDEQIIKRMQRLRKGMTLRAFAAQLGISPGYLCDVLKQHQRPGRKIELALEALTKK